MTCPSSHVTNQTDELPSLEAWLAGTLSVITGFSHAARTCPNRAQLAARAGSQLRVLGEYPQLSAPMRELLQRLAQQWEDTALREHRQTLTPHAQALWHDGADQCH